ncbi:hypothetical protein DMT42_17015 [Streptomyces actuosus]|uniref:Uncharacterized protein n=1 Tax=Streptomyces actuosus TaxID=1885 RepID=A0A2U9P2U5_STRAS|nr:hypothetical protein DMT42_17015 [Streptomyces actuosus]
MNSPYLPLVFLIIMVEAHTDWFATVIEECLKGLASTRIFLERKGIPERACGMQIGDDGLGRFISSQEARKGSHIVEILWKVIPVQSRTVDEKGAIHDDLTGVHQ